MKRSSYRRLAAAALAAACVTWVALKFSWPDVAQSLMRMRVRDFLLWSGLVLTATLVLRALRWLSLLSAPTTARNFLRAMLANGISSGLAVVTPMQAGEFVKSRLLPDGIARNRVGVPCVIAEKMLDLVCVASIGVCSWLAHHGHTKAACLALLLTPLLGVLGSFLAPRLSGVSPKSVRPYLTPLERPESLAVAAAYTLPIWMLHSLLWWIAAYCIDVRLSLPQLATLISSVTLAVVATMAPSGLGVSEVTSRGSLIWAGVGTVDAESVAIAIRLLTPAIVGMGAVCAIAWRLADLVNRKKGGP